MAKRRRQLIRAEENGREYIMDQRRGRIRKLYVDEIMARGQPVDSIWDINRLNYEDKENLGYPTQKPEALLERIINASSDPMDIVLDPFCGCGTAIAAAHKLGRRWIGIDISPTACKLMAERIRKLGVNDVRITNLPLTLDELKSMRPADFQNWVVEKLHGRASPRRMHDMGIDGYDYENTPIQVKQSENVGRNVVDNFVAAIQREGSHKGIIVAFGFGAGAYNEVARLKHPISKYQQPMEITLMPVNQLANPSSRLSVS
jgi:DNA methylase/Restriction endonuclease